MSQLRPADSREQLIWRVFNQAAFVLGNQWAGLQIIPMTIDDPALLQTLTGNRLDRVVQLTAPQDVVEQRIRQRDIALEWCLRHLEGWPHDDALGIRIETSRRAPNLIAAEILDRLVAHRR